MPVKPMSVEKHLWRRTKTGQPHECWLWGGPDNGNGYGVIGRNKEHPNLYAHRVSWELHNGPIPDGMFVLHRCDVRNCVNPRHLYLGDQAANMLDMAVKCRAAGRDRRLSLDAVADIRANYRRGSTKANGGVPETYSQQWFAIKYGVDRTTISNVLVRKTFYWLP